MLSRSRGVYAAWTLTALVLIIYGCLYPFRFGSWNHPLGPLRTLISTWRTLSGRADIVENILLYLPLGFSLYAFARGPDKLRVFISTMCGLLLSVGVEIAQYYDQLRDTTMSDVYCNTAGALAGALTGCLVRRHSTGLLTILRRRPFCALLLLIWLAYQLFPYAAGTTIPAKSSLGEVYCSFVDWLVAAQLVKVMVGQSKSYLALPVFLAVSEARFLVGHPFSLAVFLAGSAAVAFWTVLISRFRYRTQLVLILFVTALLIAQLTPARLGSGSGSAAYNWIPLRVFITEPTRVAMPSFLAECFRYGALIWLTAAAGLSFGIAVMVAISLVAFVSILKIQVMKTPADVTDMLAILALGGLMGSLQTFESSAPSQPLESQ